MSYVTIIRSVTGATGVDSFIVCKAVRRTACIVTGLDVKIDTDLDAQQLATIADWATQSLLIEAS